MDGRPLPLDPPPKPNRRKWPFVGSLDYQGLKIHVENAAGDVREGVDPDGHRWQTRMHWHYGEFADTLGVDGDPVDVYIGPDPDAPTAYVVHQKVPHTQVFDEDKVMLGFPNATEARKAYAMHYDKPGFYGGMTPWPVRELREYLRTRKGGNRLDKPLRVRMLLKGADGRWHEHWRPLTKAEQLALFGTTQPVTVKAHTRRTSSGKVVAVRESIQHRRAAVVSEPPPKPSPAPLSELHASNGWPMTYGQAVKLMEADEPGLRVTFGDGTHDTFRRPPQGWTHDIRDALLETDTAAVEQTRRDMRVQARKHDTTVEGLDAWMPELRPALHRRNVHDAWAKHARAEWRDVLTTTSTFADLDPPATATEARKPSVLVEDRDRAGAAFRQAEASWQDARRELAEAEAEAARASEAYQAHLEERRKNAPAQTDEEWLLRLLRPDLYGEQPEDEGDKLFNASNEADARVDRLRAEVKRRREAMEQAEKMLDQAANAIRRDRGNRFRRYVTRSR